MLEWLQSVWSRWKVQISFVGGALVVATTYGTCTYEPPAEDGEVSNSSTTNEVETETTNTSVPVSEEVTGTVTTAIDADSTSTTGE